MGSNISNIIDAFECLQSHASVMIFKENDTGKYALLVTQYHEAGQSVTIVLATDDTEEVYTALSKLYESKEK